MSNSGVDQIEDPKSSAIKAHVGPAITSITTSAWTTIGGFTVNDPESPGNDVIMQADNETFEFRRKGLWTFDGCVKIQNNTTGQITATVLVRLLANGSKEMRCSQRQNTEQINADSEITLPYGGSDELGPGDTVVLQYWTDNTDLTIGANSTFDNPAAVTFEAYFDGVI